MTPMSPADLELAWTEMPVPALEADRQQLVKILQAMREYQAEPWKGEEPRAVEFLGIRKWHKGWYYRTEKPLVAVEQVA